jgi:hypothetical protein
MPQNFQNWQSLGFDAAPQAPSSPSGIPGTEFQDWSNLTGPSDILKQAMGVQKPSGFNNSAAPVPPPQNWGQAMDAAIAPFQQKIDNFSNAAGQLGQGNTFGAYAAYKGQKPAVGPQPQAGQPQAEQPQEANSGGFDFSR